VLEGMNVVDEIAVTATDARDCPLETIEVNTVSFVTRKAAE
jgi:hypothetical protein